MTKEEHINTMAEIIVDILTELSENGVPDNYTVELADMLDTEGKPYKILLSVMSVDLLETLEKARPANWGGGNTIA